MANQTGGEISGVVPETEERGAEEVSELDERLGVHTNHDLVIWYFRNLAGQEVRAICTDRFIKKSKDQYNGPFLTRELVQNFVDHNPADHGTLNGVEFSETELPPSEKMPNGGSRFVITGHWPLRSMEGITGLDSEKPAEGESAGGNGIGLKQSALRLIRDFGVQKFEVDGQGWNVNYILTKADEINRELDGARAQGREVPDRRLTKDYLAAHIDQKQTKRRTCSYVIETDNPEIIAQLEKFPEYGVSNENPHLQNPDFKSEHGIIKWLPITEEGKAVEGRLFVNGQVMNYEKKGKEDWQGPDGVSLALADVKYDISIDRPPIGHYDLARYMGKMVDAMSKEDLMAQVQKAEYLWTKEVNLGGDWINPAGWKVVLEKIVDKLSGYELSQWSKNEFAKLFGDKKYGAAPISALSKDEVRELAEKGYMICPHFFEKLGLLDATNFLDKIDKTLKEKPTFLVGHALESAATEHGIPVGYEELPAETEKDAGKFFTLMAERLQPSGLAVSYVGTKSEAGLVTYNFEMDGKIEKRVLYGQLMRPNLKDPQQQLLYFLRGAVSSGLRNKFFASAGLLQGEYTSTFAAGEDRVEGKTLVQRNVENKMQMDGKVILRVDIPANLNAVLQESIGLNKQAKSISKEESAASVEATAQPTQAAAAPPVREGLLRRIGKKKWAKPLVLAAGLFGAASVFGVAEYLSGKGSAETNRPVAAGSVTPGESGEGAGENLEFGHSGDIAKFVKEYGDRLLRLLSTEEEGDGVEGGRSKRKPLAGAGGEEGKRKSLEKSDEQKLSEFFNWADKARGQTPGSTGPDAAVLKYKEWLESGNLYGEAREDVKYAGSDTLDGILTGYNEIGVESSPEESEPDAVAARMKEYLARSSAADKIEDFEIVERPSEVQMLKLDLLRRYMETIGSSWMDKTNLFIYRGKGAFGVNIGKGSAIGLHEKVLEADFARVLDTALHEVAHTKVGNHDLKFINAMQALTWNERSKLDRLLLVQSSGLGLTDQEKSLIEILTAWQKLE